MPTITWKIGDVFQVLSTLGGSSTLDVDVYGIFAKNCVVTVMKTQDGSDVGSARAESSGAWNVLRANNKISEGYPNAVPIDLGTQWVPAEVKLVLVAVMMSIRPPG